MAANCDVCGKGPSFGHSISHSHRRTKRRWNPNIQRVRTLVTRGACRGPAAQVVDAEVNGVHPSRCLNLDTLRNSSFAGESLCRFKPGQWWA